VRSTQFIRWAIPTLLALYLALRTIFPDLYLINEVILYNLIPLSALVAIFSSPRFNDLMAIAALSSAIFLWWIGSLLSSYNEYVLPISHIERYIDAIYLLFYPLLLLGLYRIRSAGDQGSQVMTLDTFGLTLILSLIFIIFITDIAELPSLPLSYQDYLSTTYLFFDSTLLMWAMKILIFKRLNMHNFLLSTGLLIYIAADIAFIWNSNQNNYSIGQLLDFGWIAGITLIAIALWSDNGNSDNVRPIYPFTITFSLLIAVALLTLLALDDGESSPLLTIPAFLALLLAIVRISSVLRKSHQLSDESQLALVDELTGLANRRKIIAELALFHEGEGAFLLLDLDGFKPINDQYGHGTGDQLLIEIAERFTRALPESAVIARLGGDEFGVIVKGSYEETLEGAYALRASLSYPFTISGQKISVGVSIGYVHNDGRGDLLKRADMAMYQAKNSDEGVVQS
jgi:diguanylate cyclase (GGDEF)-like protein